MLLVLQEKVGTRFAEILQIKIAAELLGWDVLVSPCSWRMEKELIDSKPIGVPYGSELFCEVIADQLGWKLIGNDYDWLANIPFEFVKRKIHFMTANEARFYPETKFIKPVAHKCFPAKIYEAGTFDPPEVVDINNPTLVSDIVSFQHEYRCFVKDQKVQTYSCYIKDGIINDGWENPNIDIESPDQFVDLMLTQVESKPSVIDVGLIPGSGWAIIESNEAWASGVYGCDFYQVLSVIKEAVKPWEVI